MSGEREATQTPTSPVCFDATGMKKNDGPRQVSETPSYQMKDQIYAFVDQ